MSSRGTSPGPRGFTGWLHLSIVALVILAANAVQLTASAVYRAARYVGLGGALDRVYTASSSTRLRHFFAYRLGLDPGAAGSVKARATTRTAGDMIADAGMACEEHAVTTSDGYVLGLQRIIVPLQPSPPLPLLSPPGSAQHTAQFGGGGGGGGGGSGAPGSAGAEPPTARRTRQHHRASARASVSAPDLPPLPSPPAARPLPWGHDASGLPLTPPGPQRVRGPFDGGVRNAGRPPVLIMHGLLQCSDAFLIGGRVGGLPFVLADAGYDVWLGNSRGNRYSQKHLSRHHDSDAFWDFSLDDLARYDVPALVEYVLAYTGYDRLAYVGFSQGEWRRRWRWKWRRVVMSVLVCL